MIITKRILLHINIHIVKEFKALRKRRGDYGKGQVYMTKLLINSDEKQVTYSLYSILYCTILLNVH